MTSVTFDSIRLSAGHNVDNLPQDEAETNQTEESIFAAQLATKSSTNPTSLPEHDGFHFFDRTEWDPELGDAIGCKGVLSKAGDAVGNFFKGIGNFFGNIFSGIGNFFKGLFGGKKTEEANNSDDIDDNNTVDNNKNGSDDDWSSFDGGNLPDKSQLDFNVPDDVREEIIEKFHLEFYDEHGYVSLFYDTDGELVLLTPIGINEDAKDYRQYGEIRYQSYCRNTLSDVVGIALNVESDWDTSEEDLATRDGIIGDTKQGQIGDCWLLSGVNAISYTEEGRQAIKDALEYHDGYTTVHIKGAKDYIVTDEEVEKARIDDYSTGDDDMLILELAIKKAFEDVSTKDIILDDYSTDKSVSGFDGIISEGSYPINLLYLLTGKKGSEKFEAYSGYDGTTWKENLAEAFDAFEADKENMPTVLSAYTETTIQDIDGNDVKIYAPHAYALKEVTNDTITFTNPHNSGNDITVSKDVALNTFSSYSNCDLSDSNPDCPAITPDKVYDDGSKAYIKESGSDNNIYIDAYTKDGEQLDDITINCFRGAPFSITRWYWEETGEKVSGHENYKLPEDSTLSRQEIADRITESGLIGRYDLTLEEIIEKCLS